MSAKLTCQLCCASGAVVYCQADQAFLCASCDTKVHTLNPFGKCHVRVKVCELCNSDIASVYCKNDAAHLCASCDTSIHMGNPLAARHEIVPAINAAGTTQSLVRGIGAAPGRSPSAGRLLQGGISGGLGCRRFKTLRQGTAHNLLNLVMRGGAVLVWGPPQSGKTSLLELTQAAALQQPDFRHVISISMAAGNSLDDILHKHANTSWDDFWGSSRTSAAGSSAATAGVTFERHALRLLLIDEAQLLFAPGAADDFWKNIKALLDGGTTLPNVCVVMFAMLSDQPSGMSVVVQAPTPLQFTSNIVELGPSRYHNVTLALRHDEYTELWEAFEGQLPEQQLFVDLAMRQYIYQVTGGHVGLITALMDAAFEQLAHSHRPPTPGMGDTILRSNPSLYHHGEVALTSKASASDLVPKCLCPVMEASSSTK